MCAITGIFDLYQPAPVDAALLQAMTDRQRHRGPDGVGLHREAGIGLGHRRLTVIDLTTGQQPLFNEDHSAAVIFNGEIYNHRELAAELVRYGHIFRSQCDTEVIIHAWEQWGRHCVERLRGMFAFAIWDRNKQCLFLARDRLGIKPLHYAVLPTGQLIFASEIKALLCHPLIGRELDTCAIEEYFALGYVAEPRSIYRQIRKLQAGHTLLVQRGGAMELPQCYWDVDFDHRYSGTLADASDELLARLRETVSAYSRADVPLGAFLSGGVDSSAVVAMMATGTQLPVQTCSIAFSDADFDESVYARSVAQRYATCHHQLQVSAADECLIDRLASCYDEPYADSSALPTYHLCQMARQHVTVVLSGDGGDETMAGYRRYRWHLHEERWRRALPNNLRRTIFGTLAACYPKADWAPRVFRAKTTLQALACNSSRAYFDTVSLTRDPARSALFSTRLKADLAGYHASTVMLHYAERCASEDALARIQYLDLKTYLTGDILTKVDRASMAHGLEVRVPLLDHRLVEWLATLPSHYKLNGGEGKHLFKRMLEPYLPVDLLYRKKMGFSLPLASWMRGSLQPLLLRAIRSKQLLDSGLLVADQLQRLYSQHMTGRHDHSAVLWAVLMFEAFLRQQTDSGSAAELERAA